MNSKMSVEITQEKSREHFPFWSFRRIQPEWSFHFIKRLAVSDERKNEAGKGLKTHHPQHSAPDAAQRDADELRAGRRAEATPRPAVIEASTPR